MPHKFLTAANQAPDPQVSRRTGARDFATLNHYALRSLDSYLVKNDRGDVNRENRAFDDTYWRERNDPAWEDLSHPAPPARARGRDGRAEGRSGIAALHDDCVAPAP